MNQKLILVVIAIPLVAFLVVFAGSAYAQQPTLQSVEFFSHTTDDGKDHDTGVYVHVLTSDEATLLAQIENADNCEGCEYRDWSNHTIKLPVLSPAFQKVACRKFKVKVKSRANGNDKWKFNCRVTLHFSDGTTLEKSRNNITLNSRRGRFTEVNY